MAFPVFKADGKAVDLGFHYIFRLDACFPNTGVKVPQFLKRESVLQAFHLDAVRHFAELAAGRSAHMLGWGIRRDQLRVFRFDGLQFPVQRIIFIVLQFGGVLIII